MLTRRAWAAAVGIFALLGPARAYAGAGPAPAVKVEPPTDAVTKARTLDKWGDRIGALRILLARVQAVPSDTEARTVYGTMLLWEGRHDEAREQLTRVLQDAPQNAAARGALLQLEQQSNHPDRARDVATEGLLREPERTDFLLERARAYLNLGQLTEAGADLDHLLAKEPRHPGARELRRRVRAAMKARELLVAADDLAQRAPIAGSILALFAVVPVGITLGALQNAEPLRDPHPAPAADLLADARALSHRGDRDGALRLLTFHLEATPNDSDARTLYGTILSWESRYDEARVQFARVLRDHPGHGDAIRAAIRAELWADHPEKAEDLATEALERDADAVDVLLDRARARLARDDRAGARADVDRVLELDPKNEDAKKLGRRLDATRRVWAFGGTYSLSAFSDGRSAWHEGMFQAKRTTALGSIFVRRYLASRFDSLDHQFELELFPKIREGTYADLAVAVSPGAQLYPAYRVQADLYQSLPFGLESSLGYRHLQFGSGVDMGVLSVSKYLGDWYFTARSFITPGIAGTSVSVSGSVRRYLLDGIAYVGLRYGHGLSKEELHSVNDIALLSSNTVAGEALIVLVDRVELGMRAAISQETRANRSDLGQYDLILSVGVLF